MPFLSASGMSPYNKIRGGASAELTPAQLFINAALITGATQQAALTQLVRNLQGTGSTTNNTDVWSSLSAVYPFCPIDGNTASLTAYKWNLVNPLDTDAAFRITWANSPAASINGIEGDGTTQFGNTNFKPSLDVVSIDDYGFSVSNQTLGAGGSADVDMGVYDGNFNHMIISNATYTAMIGDIASRVGGTSSTIGIRTASRTASNLLTLYLNGASDGTPATVLGGATPGIDFYILGRNDNGSLVNASDKMYDFFAIHKGLTANQAKDLNDSILTYNTALGRNFEGILDLYPNPKVAFSLRRLTGNYYGYLVKVRRSSGGEQDIGYNSSNELDTVALLAFVGAGDGFVTTWYDQSGNGSDAAQATAANQFQIVDSGVVNLSNGKPSLLVSPSAPQRMDTAAITESAERSQFCVIEKVGTGVPPYDSIYLQNAVPYMQVYVPNASTTFNYYNGANEELSGATFTLNTQQLINSNQGSASGNVYLNGVSQTSTTPPIAGATGNLTAPIVLGGFGSNGMEGNMSEYINWEGDKSSDRLGIEANIKSFYNTF